MELSRLVSGGLQRPQSCINCLPFPHFTRFFWYANFYFHFPPSRVLMKILSMGCLDVSHRLDDLRVIQAYERRTSIHFTLRCRKYHTRSVDRLPTHLPSKTHPKSPWNGTWISLHRHYHHVRRIFSTDGHCQRRVHHSVFGAKCANACGNKFHAQNHPTHLRRWLRTQRFLMHS